MQCFKGNTGLPRHGALGGETHFACILCVDREKMASTAPFYDRTASPDGQPPLQFPALVLTLSAAHRLQQEQLQPNSPHWIGSEEVNTVGAPSRKHSAVDDRTTSMTPDDAPTELCRAWAVHGAHLAQGWPHWP